ncbi:hypothetical protein NE237_000288 [Protea cynaroides]|uniref:Uncharacterized protein n=1 Tax=Protea cynaroides TaxID=273540 RepID=A0A9Q0KR61_9MAGN|nr:hypothetical protein NE237_000288 [Protea cynaroides]
MANMIAVLLDIKKENRHIQTDMVTVLWEMKFDVYSRPWPAVSRPLLQPNLISAGLSVTTLVCHHGRPPPVMNCHHLMPALKPHLVLPASKANDSNAMRSLEFCLGFEDVNGNNPSDLANLVTCRKGMNFRDSKNLRKSGGKYSFSIVEGWGNQCTRKNFGKTHIRFEIKFKDTV